jgi:hypothetical protein
MKDHTQKRLSSGRHFSDFRGIDLEKLEKKKFQSSDCKKEHVGLLFCQKGFRLEVVNLQGFYYTFFL